MPLINNEEYDNQFHEKLSKLLEEVAKSNGFTNYTITKGCDFTKGDGYMGTVNTVNIASKDDEKELNLIVKCAPKNDALRETLKIPKVYKRESYMYSKLLPLFQEIQKVNGLPLSHFSPAHYKSLLEDKFETIVLENLKTGGFKMCERRTAMNEDHVRLVITEYARFHALSFVLRDRNQKTFHKISKNLYDFIASIAQTTGLTGMLMNQCTKAQSAFDENKDKELLKVYKLFVNGIPSFIEGMPSTVDEYSVVLHGDCWTNNMMFKYEENPTKPTGVRFLDYQMSRMGSPITDISYFLYACSPKEIIDNLDKYLQLYHNSLSDYLRQFGCDPAKLFPYAVLEEHWRKYSRYGLAFAMLILYVMLTEEEEVADMSDALAEKNTVASTFDYDLKNKHIYYDRVKAVIMHCFERKFI